MNENELELQVLQENSQVETDILILKNELTNIDLSIKDILQFLESEKELKEKELKELQVLQEEEKIIEEEQIVLQEEEKNLKEEEELNYRTDSIKLLTEISNTESKDYTYQLDELNENLSHVLNLGSKIQEIGFHSMVLGLVIIFLVVIYNIFKKFF